MALRDLPASPLGAALVSLSLPTTSAYRLLLPPEWLLRMPGLESLTLGPGIYLDLNWDAGLVAAAAPTGAMGSSGSSGSSGDGLAAAGAEGGGGSSGGAAAAPPPRLGLPRLRRLELQQQSLLATNAASDLPWRVLGDAGLLGAALESLSLPAAGLRLRAAGAGDAAWPGGGGGGGGGAAVVAAAGRSTLFPALRALKVGTADDPEGLPSTVAAALTRLTALTLLRADLSPDGEPAGWELGTARDVAALIGGGSGGGGSGSVLAALSRMRGLRRLVLLPAGGGGAAALEAPEEWAAAGRGGAALRAALPELLSYRGPLPE
jgi:hypothetical protein